MPGHVPSLTRESRLNVIFIPPPYVSASKTAALLSAEGLLFLHDEERALASN